VWWRERKHRDRFYGRPSQWRRWLWWRLGWDHLTVRERLAQVRAEAADCQFWLIAAEDGNDRLLAVVSEALGQLTFHDRDAPAARLLAGLLLTGPHPPADSPRERGQR
jgi:hypothetical protein